MYRTTTNIYYFILFNHLSLELNEDQTHGWTMTIKLLKLTCKRNKNFSSQSLAPAP